MSKVSGKLFGWAKTCINDILVTWAGHTWGTRTFLLINLCNLWELRALPTGQLAKSYLAIILMSPKPRIV